MRQALSGWLKRNYEQLALGYEISKYELQNFKEGLQKTLKILDLWLSKSEFICGSEISIADLACLNEFKTIEVLGINYDEFKNLS